MSATSEPGSQPATPSEPEVTAGLRCSAKGCAADAVWVLRWNNPRLHEPERRKEWLACEAHRPSLGQHLAVRGFLREVEPLPRA